MISFHLPFVHHSTLSYHLSVPVTAVSSSVPSTTLDVPFAVCYNVGYALAPWFIETCIPLVTCIYQSSPEPSALWKCITYSSVTFIDHNRVLCGRKGSVAPTGSQPIKLKHRLRDGTAGTGFGVDRTGSKRRGPGLCVLLTFMRSWGLRRTWRSVESSGSYKKNLTARLPQGIWDLIVSCCKRCYFLRALTIILSLENIDDCVECLVFILLKVPSPHLPSCLYSRYSLLQG